MNAAKGTVRIGTSGYQYDHWRGVFYPEDSRKKNWFSIYAHQFDTVEINNTFYGLPEPETFDRWRDQAPGNFCYALKFSRYGSHLKHLTSAADTIGVFLERAERLEEHLGPILVQLPPNWNVDAHRLERFLEAAPARRRWALEFRDPSWLCTVVFDILREHKAALCIHDMIDDHPLVQTADWVYLRFHGKHYAGSYTPQALTAQARRIRNWRDAGTDVYAFFNNDAEGFAAANARDLRRYVDH